MSNQQYSMDYGGEAPQQSGMAVVLRSAEPTYRIVMPPQKKRISAGAGMFFGIILCGAALYGAEMFAPPEYRPSIPHGLLWRSLCCRDQGA